MNNSPPRSRRTCSSNTIDSDFWVKNDCIRCRNSAHDWKLHPVGFQDLEHLEFPEYLLWRRPWTIDSGYLHDRSTYESEISILCGIHFAIPENRSFSIGFRGRSRSPKFFFSEIVLSRIQNGLNNVTLYAEVATEPYLVNNLAVSCTDFSNSNSIHL